VETTRVRGDARRQCMGKRHGYVVMHAGKDVGASSDGDVRGTRLMESKKFHL